MWRDIRAQLGQTARRVAQMRRDNIGRRDGVVRPTRGEQLVTEESECVDVALGRDGLGQELLGTHVGRRAHGHSRRRDPHVTLVAFRLLKGGDAEVGHRRALTLVVPQHVRRFHVAMHDAAAVCRGECRGDVTQHAFSDVDGKRARRSKPLRHAAPGNVLHDEVRRAVGELAHTKDRDDICVRDRGDGLRLTLKTCVRFFVGTAGLEQHLDRDEALELRITPEVHATHAAFTDRAYEQHATAKGRLERDGNRVMLQRWNRSVAVRLARRARRPGGARHWR